MPLRRIKKRKQRLYLHPTSQERHFVPLPLEALSSVENPSRNLHQRLATNLKEKEGQQVSYIHFTSLFQTCPGYLKGVKRAPDAGGRRHLVREARA